MTGARTLAWIERLAWVLLYGGLLTLVLGLASTNYGAAAAWSLMIAGAIFAVGGVVLIWVRSRLR